MLNQNQTVSQVSLDQLELPKRELRRLIPREGLEELSGSIKRLGVINPLTVIQKGKRYIIVAGTRRYLAAKMANLAVVPVTVVKADDATQEEIKVQENISREDVNPVDQAEHIKMLKGDLKLTHEQIASIYNRSTGWVSQVLHILTWDPGYIEAVKAGLITWKVGQILMKIPERKDRDYVLQFAVRGGCTQEKAQGWLQQYSGHPYVPPVTPPVPQQPGPEMEGPQVTTPCFCCGTKTRTDAMYLVRLCPKCYPELVKSVQKEK